MSQELATIAEEVETTPNEAETAPNETEAAPIEAETAAATERVPVAEPGETNEPAEAETIETVEHDADTPKEGFVEAEEIVNLTRKRHKSGERDRVTLTKRLTVTDVGDGDAQLEDAGAHSDSDGSIDSLGAKQHSISMPPDFFEILGSVPDIADISEDVSVVDVLEEEVVEPTTADEVAPDEGKIITTAVEDEVIEAEPEDEGAAGDDADGVDEETEEEAEEESDDDFIPDDDEEDTTKKPLEDDVFETFLDIIEPERKKATEKGIDFEAQERAEAARKLRVQTAEFLDALIAQLVDKCEYVDPNTLLRQTLDKDKLMREIHSKLLDLDAEQKTRFFLNRKTVDYFRRKKTFRSIIEDHSESVQVEAAKYKDIIKQLDYMLGKEGETKQCTALKIENLELELSDWQQRSRAEIQNFEELVRKTLQRDNFDRLQQVVENQLGRLSSLRDEISQCRLLLLQRQHTFAVLLEKLDKLENLGNGLRMRDFEHLQTETQALGKKIEERNAELSKLRTRCNADLHIMAHMKEKQQMMRNTIGIQESALQELMDEKQQYREYLYNLKMTRDRVRKEIRELSFQGGLLDKPALMLDYDDTTERLDKLRIKVEQMRAKYADIQQKIHTLEAKYDEK